MNLFRKILSVFVAFNVLVFLTGATEGELRAVSLAMALACAVGAYYLWPKPRWFQSAERTQA